MHPVVAVAALRHARLSAALEANRELAVLFRKLATLRTDVPVFDRVDELRWRGPMPEFERVAERMATPGLWKRAQALAPSP